MMNAGAAAVQEGDEDDLDGERRDIFDWLYVLLRVFVLFSVVYSYSSLARFALIAIIGLCVYFFREGFNNQGQHGAAAAENQQHQAAAPAEDQQQAAAARPDQPAGDVEENPGVAAENGPPQQPVSENN